jgi:metaxin
MADFSWFTPLSAFYAHFPLHTYPAVYPPSSFSLERPTLWIARPRGTGSLSADVECLKWQAYLALRGVTNVAVRWDISPDGALGGRFPNLQIPPSANDDGKGKLLPSHMIPAWVDEKVGASTDPLEGYKDEASRDESYAWVALLEGNVHAALVSVFASSSQFAIRLISF